MVLRYIIPRIIFHGVPTQNVLDGNWEKPNDLSVEFSQWCGRVQVDAMALSDVIEKMTSLHSFLIFTIETFM